MKKYLACKVTQHNGNTFSNPLKLSEAYLISQLAQQNINVFVELIECSKEQYKYIFG